MKVLATYNIKGGVGKTATAVNLGYLAAREGYRTLVWDLDPQGAATFYFRVRPRIKGGSKKLIRGKLDLDRLIRATDFVGLDLLPADFSYRHMDRHLGKTGNPMARIARLLLPLEAEYDLLILDCAPSISLVSEAVFVASDALLVPTIPTILSLRTLDQLAEYLSSRRGRRPLTLPFYCMADRRKSLHRRIIEDPEAASLPFLETSIPYSSIVERMGVRRAPVGAFARSSLPARAYEALWREIRERTP